MDVQGPASEDVGAGAGPSSDALALTQDAQGATVDRSKHPSGIEPTLQNIVATVDLGVKLDLKAIALGARNAEYNPKVRLACKTLSYFPWLYHHLTTFCGSRGLQL